MSDHQPITDAELAENVRPLLTVELVPSTCWYANVRSEVSPEQWNTIRRKAYKQAGYRCEVCGSRGTKHPVECHEVWHYDDCKKTQRLVRMIALCPACHEVKHIGLAQMRGNLQRALKQLAQVNAWSMEKAEKYVSTAFRLWESRSEHGWELDISALDLEGESHA